MNKTNIISIFFHILFIICIILNYVNKTGIILYLIVMINEEILRGEE